MHMRLETKKNEKTRSSAQISGVMVSPKIVSPRNGVTRDGRSPPSYATALTACFTLLDYQKKTSEQDI